MPTYTPNLKTVSTQNLSGASVTMFNAGLMGLYRRIVFFSILGENGLKASVFTVNDALLGKHWRGQPFGDSLISRFEGSTVILPNGYIGHSYYHHWQFLSDPTISFYSGTMPPGLAFSMPTIYDWQITGTPTTLGTYNFTLLVVTASTFGYINLQITVLADPDEGVGGVGGG